MARRNGESQAREEANLSTRRLNRMGLVLIVALGLRAGPWRSPASATADDAPSPPNLVYILADDLGYGDLGCYNPASKIPTPHLDRLAAEGLRFTDAHTPSAVCTPTRYGVLTGRYCWRTWLTSGVLDGFDPPLVEADRMTVARLLAEHGYATHCIGKWHLGMQWTTLDGAPVGRRDPAGGFRPGDDVDFKRATTGGPIDCGFRRWFGISASLDMPPYCFMRNDRILGTPTTVGETRTLFLNQTAGVTVESFQLSDVLPRLADEAVETIERHATAVERRAVADPARPLFIYMPLTAPHLPVLPSP